MIKKLLLSFSLLGALIILSSGAMDDNGRAGKTNSPGEQTCVNSCHNSYVLNSGPGSITISAAGMTGWQYNPGQVYDMTVTVAQTGVNLFGVGIEALLASGSNGGTLTISDAVSTRLKYITVSGASRTNVVHQLNGGANPNSKNFNFKWTAPAAGSGNVTFYFSGNAANGTGNENGDYIYNSNQVITESCAAPAQPASITGTPNVCEGTISTYTIPAVSGATSYTWTLPPGTGWYGSSTTNSIDVTVGAAAGDLTVTANNACGSSPTQAYTINPQALPAQPVISSSQSEVDTLNCSSTWPCQWYFNGGIINGATYPAYVPTQNGTYSVVVTNTNGCSSTSTDFTYTTLGIKDASKSNLISVYPTPASGFIMITVDSRFINSDVTIMDIRGKTIMKKNINDANTRIDLDGISEGVYFAVMGGDSDKSVVRFFVSK